MNLSTKKIFVAGTVIVLAFLFFMDSQVETPSRQQGKMAFPWQIDVRPDGLSRVFGITLRETTLDVVQTSFRDGGEMKLFVSPSGEATVEVFFKSIAIDGIRGKIVLLLDPDQEDMEAMLSRGTRMKALPGGARKVSLHPEDRERLRYTPISAITYLPSADLDESVIRQRFGQPGKRIPEQDNPSVVHWLYPHLGLDIALNRNGKEIFQYVPPGEFQRLMDGF